MTADPSRFALLGPMRAGKNSIAEIIGDHFGKFVYEYAFAEALKRTVKGLVLPETRQTYQELGMILREYKDDIWVDILADTIERDRAAYHPDIVAITDIRMRNEYRWCAEVHNKRRGYYACRSATQPGGDRICTKCKMGH